MSPFKHIPNHPRRRVRRISRATLVIFWVVLLALLGLSIYTFVHALIEYLSQPLRNPYYR